MQAKKQSYRKILEGTLRGRSTACRAMHEAAGECQHAEGAPSMQPPVLTAAEVHAACRMALEKLKET
jgi:hypothetical protein